MTELRKTHTCHPLERVEQARAEKARALFGYWQRLQAAGKPTRGSLDPLEMKPYLANLLTGNVETEALPRALQAGRHHGRGILAVRLLQQLPGQAGL